MRGNESKVVMDMRRILTPEGLFIYERGSGLCLFTPEIKAPAWEVPLFAQIALTSKCNLSCWYCYNKTCDSEWEIGALRELVSFLDSWGVLGVSFGGGEPFLYSHLREIVQYTWNETGLDATLTTNGLAASTTQIKALEGYISEVRVSIHGPSSIACLEKFTGRQLDIGANLLLFRGGAKILEHYIIEAMKFGVSDFLINSFQATGNQDASMQPCETDYAELAGVIRKYSRRATFKVSSRLAERLGPYIRSYIGGFLPFQRESPGRIIAITADSKVKLSSLSQEGEPFREPEEIPQIYRSLLKRRCVV